MATISKSNGGAKKWSDRQRHTIEILRQEFLCNSRDTHDLLGRICGPEFEAAARPHYSQQQINDEFNQRENPSKAWKIWGHICQSALNQDGPYTQEELDMREEIRDEIISAAARVGGRNWLLEDVNGNLSRPINPISLSPVAGSLAAAAIARAPANVQTAINGTGPGIPAPPALSSISSGTSGQAMSASAYNPMANASTSTSTASATNTVTTPSASRLSDHGRNVVGEGEQTVQGEARHDPDQEEDVQVKVQSTQNTRTASRAGGKSFQDRLQDMLEDDEVDDDEVLFETTPVGRVALQAHQQLPMVHQDYIVFGPRSSRDPQYITSAPASFPRINGDDNVYKYGGAVVRTIGELSGTITDLMVCSKDICKNERCYTPPGKRDPVKPDHTPMPFNGMPFVHTKRDCVVRDGATYFEGVLDIPNSSWSSLPPQVEDIDVMFIVDGEEIKVRVQGCVVNRCPICQRVAAHERLVAAEEEAAGDRESKVTGRRNAGRAAKGKGKA